MKRRIVVVLLLALSAAAALPSASAQRRRGDGGGRQTVTGTVVGIGGRYARSYPLTLRVESYTSPSEISRLNEALQQGGQDGLLRAISGLDSGRIAVGTGVGVQANVVISTPQPDGGTRLTVLFERTVNFYELRRGARSQDYRFGYAEIFIDRDGRGGEGTFIPAAKVRLRDGNTWEVEDFGIFPARIMGVRSRGTVPAR